MSGRYEKDMAFENKTKLKLQNEPAILTEYYYSLIGSGKSYATVYNYICYIINFLNFINHKKHKEDFYTSVKPVNINKYIASLRTKTVNGEIKKTSDSIRTLHWSALNSFFQFLIPEYININPVSFTKRPQMKDNPNVTYLNQDEITLILKNVEDNAKERFKNRDLCILKLGFSTGLRVSAIVQIDIDDIDFVNNQIKVTEKGDRDEYVMFGDRVKDQLIAWLEDRKKYFKNCRTNALFISQRNVRMSTDGIRKIITKYTDGITDKHITPHVMRHSCATNLYEKTGDIYLCASQLNHRNVATTQRYAEISKSRKIEAANILDDLI